MNRMEKLVIGAILAGFLLIFHKSLKPFIVPISLFGGMGALAIFLSKERDRLRKEYEDAKVALRKDPQNPFLREAFVIAGRRYYSANRQGDTTPTDEAAIQTDMMIITGENKKTP